MGEKERATIRFMFQLVLKKRGEILKIAMKFMLKIAGRLEARNTDHNS